MTLHDLQAFYVAPHETEGLLQRLGLNRPADNLLQLLYWDSNDGHIGAPFNH